METPVVSATLVLHTAKPCSIPDIYKTFEKFGTITGVKVAVRSREEETKYLSFVIFSSRDNAQNAYSNASDLSINGEKILTTEYAIKRPGSRNFGPQSSKKRAHVDRKPEGLEKEQLQQIFGCETVIIPQDKEYFFVEYPTENDMGEAMRKLNDTKYPGTDVMIKMSAAHLAHRNRSRPSGRGFGRKNEGGNTPKVLQ